MALRDIIIIGAGGQSRNTSLIIEQIGSWRILGFCDDDPTKKEEKIRGYSVLGSVEQVCNEYNNVSFVLAIGNPDVMQKIISYIKSKDRTYFFPNIIHPSVQIDFNEVKMGEGNVIFPNALFLSDITIGNFNFFNFNSAISHEVKIGDYCLVQPGVNILGQIILKNKAYCGANSTIVEKRIIGENAIVGAGAVVTKDVEDNAIVVGNPAKLLRYKEERIK